MVMMKGSVVFGKVRWSVGLTVCQKGERIRLIPTRSFLVPNDCCCRFDPNTIKRSYHTNIMTTESTASSPTILVTGANTGKDRLRFFATVSSSNSRFRQGVDTFCLFSVPREF